MRILVIEDEPRILEFLSRGLQAEGFVVDGAGDGPAGLARAITGQYNLVVLDLLLPKLGDFPQTSQVLATVTPRSGPGEARPVMRLRQSRCEAGGHRRRTTAPGACRATSREYPSPAPEVQPDVVPAR